MGVTLNFREPRKIPLKIMRLQARGARLDEALLLRTIGSQQIYTLLLKFQPPQTPLESLAKLALEEDFFVSNNE